MPAKSSPLSNNFYNKREYLKELVKRFDAVESSGRILLMTMSFDPDEPEIMAIIDSLERAAKRGVRVHFNIDARSFLHANGKPGPDWRHPSRFAPLIFNDELPTTLQTPYALKKACLDRLARYPNVTIAITNHPHAAFRIPFAGRSHIKLAIIDDYYIISGCNLDSPSYIDLGIGFIDTQTSDTLYQLFTGVIERTYVKEALHATDQTIQIDSTARILIDAGVRNQSLILDEALKLIDDAREWLTITCQYFPNAITADHLHAALQRGVKVKVLFTYLWDYGPVDGAIQLVSQFIERMRLPAGLFAYELSPGTHKIHAKLIASDAGCMVGSHNYLNAGVRFGTAEIAYHSTDGTLARHMSQKIQDQLIGG